MSEEHIVYMDYQASTPMSKSVLDAMLPYFTDNYANPHASDHSMGWNAAKAIDNAKNQVALMIGADRDEIIFTSGATESNNQALFSVARAISKKKKRILVGATEHKCVIESARFAAVENDLEVDYIPVDDEGFIDIESYKSLLSHDVGLISVMLANNEVGTLQDIKLLAELAKKYDVIFHCDAAQGPIATDIDVVELGVDLMSLSAHKIYGPKGVGALFISEELINRLSPIIYGGSQQNGLRAGTLPTAQCVGFGVACEALLDMDLERQRLLGLKKLFISSLSSSTNFVVNGPQDFYRCHPGNINLFFPKVDSSELLMRLQPNVCASSGSACNSGFIEGSYVIKAMGHDSDRVENSIRFSIGKYTTGEQIEFAVSQIEKALLQCLT